MAVLPKEGAYETTFYTKMRPKGYWREEPILLIDPIDLANSSPHTKQILADT
jgi:hypothetical protein